MVDLPSLSNSPGWTCPRAVRRVDAWVLCFFIFLGLGCADTARAQLSQPFVYMSGGAAATLERLEDPAIALATAMQLTIARDPALGGDSLCCDCIVAGDHTDHHAGVLRLADSFRDAWADRILDADYPEKRERGSFKNEAEVCFLWVGRRSGTCRGPLGEILVCEADGPEAVFGVGGDAGFERLPC